MSFSEKKSPCPYCKVLILPDRIQRHLVKCEIQHPDSQLIVCKFNWAHRIDPQRYNDHLATCPDRGMIENEEIKHAYKSDDVTTGNPALVPRPVNLAKPESSEDWEAEMTNSLPYDATANAMSKLVLRAPKKSMTKSEKIKFREEEIERLSGIEARGATHKYRGEKEGLFGASADIETKTTLRKPASAATTNKLQTDNLYTDPGSVPLEALNWKPGSIGRGLSSRGRELTSRRPSVKKA